MTSSCLQGWRTLDDIRQHAKLNGQQEIGLKHYDDILERMPRDEAQEIADTVGVGQTLLGNYYLVPLLLLILH